MSSSRNEGPDGDQALWKIVDRLASAAESDAKRQHPAFLEDSFVYRTALVTLAVVAIGCIVFSAFVWLNPEDSESCREVPPFATGFAGARIGAFTGLFYVGRS